ncbi:tail fiber protein [Pseudomonas sp. PNPG3]|uniref:tail fiber protein n=1 Tax=Pseudomonas sp. PNPG3 TaxID=2919497 RepID=UPI001FFD8C7A|nr:tail fiber protein [Pseudomonas sp. PNPG3]MCK2122107.1 tail fiber protein [Pseudomonas sp. PNPG3]
MYDPLIINPAMTLGGKQAAFAASANGMTLKLTHVQFGTGMYDPKGTETALKTPVGSRITLAGGARPTQYQIRMLAAWREDLGGETPITEIGYYAGNVLAFIWSNEDGEAAFIKTDGVPAVLFSDIGFESVPAGSVDITVDPAEQVALAALAAHESASNAHPQYVEHALFPDAQADMWMTVTGSANALVLTPPIDVKVPAYKTGQAFRFKAAYSSTGPVSANIAGLGAKSVVKTGGTVLAPGDLRVGAIYDLIYDGARFQLAGGVGGGQFYVEWPTVATANQTKFNGAYTPGSEMVFVNGTKLAKDKYTATDGQTFTLTTAVAAGTLVTMVAYSTFAVADTYSKAEYQSFVATLDQAQNKATTVVDRWMNPNLVHAAITARVQPTLYDTTAGSLLVPGSFGIGATKLNATGSIDNLTASGTYGWGAATTGRPVDGEAGEVIHMTGDTAAFATQLVTSHTSKRAWLRRKNNNTWATVELFTSDNQLRIGTTAETARAALELGNAALATLTTNNRDSTIGRVLRVGDFGLGSTDLTDLQLDLDTLTATGFYLVTSSSTNMPLSSATGMVIVMTNASKWTQQIFMPQSSTRMFQRASNNGAWSAWTEVWNGNNLEKTTSTSDSTVGRMLKVGDYGIGSKVLMTNNLITNIDDVTLPNGMYAVSNTTTGTKPSTYGILMHEGRNNVASTLGRVAQTFIDVDQPNNPRIFHRVYISASDTWGAWYEDWHTGNLIKTTSNTDTTAGRMVKVGDYGLGSQLSVTDANDAVISGFYRLDSTYKNSPAVGKAVWILVQAYNSNVLQYASLAGTATSEMWIRKKVAGTNAWTAWAELAKVGDYGLGAITMPAITSIDDQTLGNGWYAVSAGTTGTKPLNAAIAGVLHVSGRNNFAGTGGRVAQTFYATDGAPRVWNRTYTGTAADSVWSAWVESWHSGNLVKTEAVDDNTVGRMLKVGDFGIGAMSVSLGTNSVDSIVAGGIYHATKGTTPGTWPSGATTCDLTLPVIIHAAANTSASQSQLLIDRDSNTFYYRGRASSAWKPWTKVATPADITAALAAVGFGLTGAANAIPGNANLNDYTTSGSYGQVQNAQASLAQNYPVAKAGTLFVQNGGSTITTQLYQEYDSGRVWNRARYNSTWSAWSMCWDTDTLVKTTTATDSTPGRMLKVGDYGLGGQVSVTDANDALLSGFYRLNSTYKNSPVAGKAAWILVQAYDNSVIQYAAVAGVTTADMWVRKKLGTSGVWGAWSELVKVGDFGLGATYMPYTPNLDDQTLANGWYAFSSSVLGAKPADVSYGVLLVSGRNNIAGNGGRVSQTIFTTEGAAPRIWNRIYYGTLSNTEWSEWVESWTTGNLVKTSSDLDTTAGRMLKVGDYGLGTMVAPKTVINSNAEWGKPAGWSGFIDIAASKAKGATVPLTLTGATPTYGMWQIVGRRDSNSGYTGIFTDYASGRLWLGYAMVGADGPTFKELFSEVSVSAFAQTLLDDTTQAAAQNTLGIPALINTLVYGITTKDISGNANITLTATEAAAGILWFTGALTGNVDVIVPTGQNKWTVYNRTTGNYTLRLKTASGVGQYVPQGKQADIINGGTNLYFGANAFPDARFTGELTVADTKGIRLIDSNAKYGTIWRNDGGYLYLLLTEANDAEGPWSTKRPFTLNLTTGLLAFNEGATVGSPAARDNSSRIPGTSWVQAEIEYNTRRYTNVGIGASGNITLTAADAGRWLNMTGVGSTATLPASSSIGNGLVYQIRNQSSGVVKVTHSGGNIQQETGNNSGTLNLQYNEWVELTSSASSYWITGRGKLEEAATVSQLGDRVGEIAFFAGETVPDGFLKRNGAAVSRTAYKALFNKIGTKFGVGDGSTTFNLPDDRGLFIRGFSDGSDIDPGRVFGSIQTDQNASHTHTGTAATGGAHSHTMTFPRDLVDGSLSNDAVFGDQIEEGTQTMSTSTAGSHTHTLNINTAGGDEARPINRAYLPCIKY